MTPQPQNAAAESASCLTSAMLRVARLALSTSASQLSQACHTKRACHSAGFLGEKQLSNNFTTCFSDLKGACLASQQPVGKTSSRPRLPEVATCKRFLKVSLEPKGHATKRRSTQRKQTSLQLACLSCIYHDPFSVSTQHNTSLQLACHSRIYLESCSDYEVRGANLEHINGVVKLRARTGFSLQQAAEARAFVHIEKPRAQQSCPAQDSRNHNLVSMRPCEDCGACHCGGKRRPSHPSLAMFDKHLGTTCQL